MCSRTVLLVGSMAGLGAIFLSCCANPAAQTYQKGIDGGQKAIEKARGVQQTVNQTKTIVEQQATEAEGGTKSP